MSVVAMKGMCGLCHNLEFNIRKLAREMERVQRWQKEGGVSDA